MSVAGGVAMQDWQGKAQSGGLQIGRFGLAAQER